MLSLIFARSENRCIGNNGGLPWSLPEDSAFFHRTTAGAAVIMGRGTYEDHLSLLPDRLNVVVTRQTDYPVATGVLLADSLRAALTVGEQSGGDIFVIGGAGLLVEALPIATRVYETIVAATIDGDTFLPELDLDDFNTTQLLHQPVDVRHGFAFSVFEHRRRN